MKLPEHIEAKNVCVNILCNDGKSFKWCVLAHKYPVANNQRPERVSNYYAHHAEFDGYKYPMEVQSIRHFERKERIAVNVYCITDEGTINTLQCSDMPPGSATMHVDMLKVGEH